MTHPDQPPTERPVDLHFGLPRRPVANPGVPEVEQEPGSAPTPGWSVGDRVHVAGFGEFVVTEVREGGYSLTPAAPVPSHRAAEQATEGSRVERKWGVGHPNTQHVIRCEDEAHAREVADDLQQGHRVVSRLVGPWEPDGAPERHSGAAETAESAPGHPGRAETTQTATQLDEAAVQALARVIDSAAAEGVRYDGLSLARWISLSSWPAGVAAATNTTERLEDAARQYAAELERLRAGLEAYGIPIPPGRPVDTAPVDAALIALVARDRGICGARAEVEDTVCTLLADHCGWHQDDRGMSWASAEHGVEASDGSVTPCDTPAQAHWLADHLGGRVVPLGEEQPGGDRG